MLPFNLFAARMILIMFQMENIKEENIRQNNAEEVCNPTHERNQERKIHYTPKDIDCLDKH